MKYPQLSSVRRSWRVAVALFGILAMIGINDGLLAHNASATGALTTVRIYLNRQQTNIASAVTMQVFFTTVGSVASGGQVKLTFPNDSNDNTKWCRTAGSDLVATGITDPTGGSEGATALTSSSSFTTSCAQGTPDTITITAVAALSPTTKYGVQIAQAGSPTALLGTANTTGDLSVTVGTYTSTPTLVDQGTATVDIITTDQVSVTASVTPTISVTLSGNAVGLQTLDSTHINYIAITSQVSANGTGGYLSVVNYNNTLTDASSDTIANAGGTVTAGTAGYGASTSKSGQTISQSSASPSCSTSWQQQTGSANATTLTTGFQSFASSSSPVSADTTTLCFLAAIAYNSKPGSYTSTSTVVTTGRF